MNSRAVSGSMTGWPVRGSALRFPLLLFDNFLAQFAFGGEGAAVDDTKSFFFLVVRQGAILSSFELLNFSIGVLVWVAEHADQELCCQAATERDWPPAMRKI